MWLHVYWGAPEPVVPTYRQMARSQAGTCHHYQHHNGVDDGWGVWGGGGWGLKYKQELSSMFVVHNFTHVLIHYSLLSPLFLRVRNFYGWILFIVFLSILLSIFYYLVVLCSCYTVCIRYRYLWMLKSSVVNPERFIPDPAIGLLKELRIWIQENVPDSTSIL